ncbi:MAG: hypothetical protein ABSG43_14600 [Solirubrobacteraceae bacterium]
MTTETLHPLAAKYLERLRRAGRRLPPGRLQELLTEIEGHLTEAIDPGASDAQALTALEKLGEPEAIIAAEMPPPDEPPAGRGTKEWAAIILLLLGGFIFGVGWIAGLVLLWSSRAWNTREKWVGTLVIPGGLATGVLIGLIAIGVAPKKLCRVIAGGVQHCTNAPEQSASILGVAVFALLVLASAATRSTSPVAQLSHDTANRPTHCGRTARPG